MIEQKFRYPVDEKTKEVIKTMNDGFNDRVNRDIEICTGKSKKESSLLSTASEQCLALWSVSPLRDIN